MSKKLISRFSLVIIFVLVTAVSILATVRAVSPNQESPPPRLALENFSDPPLLAQDVQFAAPEATTARIPWSKVVFQSYRDGNWEIYLGNDDGSGQTRLTNNGLSDIHPRLNRGGTHVVFASNRDGDYEIFIMNADGSGLTKLTSNTTDDVNPVWSPDGTKIVFQAYRDGQPEIYVMNANGSAPTRLTTDSDYDGTPTWSPNGDKIAFVSRRTGGYRIYSMNADGSGLTRISSQPYSFNPAWSPDGSKIAYDADSDGDGWQDLWLMNHDGTNQQNIYDPYGQPDAWARSWSPDGRYIAFTQITFVQYNGNWYWTNAYLDARDTQNSLQVRLSNNGLDWNPDWQTQDDTPPISGIHPLEPYSRIGGLIVSWYGQDNLSGIKNFEVQYRSETDPDWQSWLMTTETNAEFDLGVIGSTYYFRARAIDVAGNVEEWTNMTTTNTTLFTRKLSGQITDTRGAFLSTPSLDSLPTPVSSNIVSENGIYHMWLSDFYTHTISITANSYGSLPPVTKWITDDLNLDYVLPPFENIIDNSNFEDELSSSAWQINGVQPPEPTNEVSHTGKWAVKLGYPPPRNDFLEGNLCVRPAGDTFEPGCAFTSIQSAIDAAQPNQTIWVFPGEYHEALILNKSDIALRSVLGPQLTIIDVTGIGTAIRISGSWGNTYQHILVEGFTMRNGGNYYDGGGLSASYASDLTIQNNWFVHNHGALAGAIRLSNGAEFVNIINNWFIDNYTSGTTTPQPNCIAGRGNDILIANNVFMNNDQQGAAAIYLYYSSTGAIYNNTFVRNKGGISIGCYFDVQNNIIIESLGTGLAVCSPPQYNNVWNNNPNYSGTDYTGSDGNISANPSFDGDFRLRSISPSLNTGNPDSSFNDPDGSRNDMGAYGGPYAMQKGISPSAWTHAWYDLSSWSGETITFAFQLQNNLSGIVRSELSQVISLTESIDNPTLSFLYWTGQESTSGNESFVVTIESESGQITEFTIVSSAENQLWAYLDEVTLGSAYIDLQVDMHGTKNALPGEEIIYTINYANLGGVDANAGIITMILPDELTFTDANISPISTAPLAWDVGNLPAFSESSTIIITATVASSATPLGTISARVDIASASSELEIANNQSTHDLFIGRFIYLPAINKK